MKKRYFLLGIGGGIIVAMVELILWAFFWTPYNTTEMNAAAKFQGSVAPASAGHGQLWPRHLQPCAGGSSTLLSLIGICEVIGCFFGILIGSLCGYYGGIPDLILTRICDSITAFPPSRWVWSSSA